MPTQLYSQPLGMLSSLHNISQVCSSYRRVTLIGHISHRRAAPVWHTSHRRVFDRHAYHTVSNFGANSQVDTNCPSGPPQWVVIIAKLSCEHHGYVHRDQRDRLREICDLPHAQRSKQRGSRAMDQNQCHQFLNWVGGDTRQGLAK
jgi:hypothetical protein